MVLGNLINEKGKGGGEALPPYEGCGCFLQSQVEEKWVGWAGCSVWGLRSYNY